ncbi:MAG TPA: hypothetical protein VF785_04975, partial [Gemmatimonadaceae bacterium]
VRPSCCIDLDTRSTASSSVSDHLTTRYDAACKATDRVIVAGDRLTVVHDRLFKRSGNLFGRSDSWFGVADHLIASNDSLNTGAGRSLNAFASGRPHDRVR